MKREKAEKIKNAVVKWLKEDLKLKISKDKTKIVKADKGTKFLGYLLKVNLTNATRTKKTNKSSLNGETRTLIPKEKILQRIRMYG